MSLYNTLSYEDQCVNFCAYSLFQSYLCLGVTFEVIKLELYIIQLFSFTEKVCCFPEKLVGMNHDYNDKSQAFKISVIEMLKARNVKTIFEHIINPQHDKM